MRGPQAEKIALERIRAQIKEFPGYAQIYRAGILPQPWTIENGLLTPTMKIKRAKVVEAHKREFDTLYAGH
jgi:long-chain acyl-CoA synthetase